MTSDNVTDTITDTSNTGKSGSGAFIIAALLLASAVIILIISGFWRLWPSGGSQGHGPDTFTEENTGHTSKVNVDMILGFYAQENKAEKVTRIYAVLPISDGQYATVILPERYFDSARAVQDSTIDLLDKLMDAPENYFEVQGSVETLSDDALGLFYDWFSDNSFWIEYAGLPVADDLAHIISPYVLKADYVGGLHIIQVYVLIVLGAVLILLAAAITAIAVIRRDSKVKKPLKVEDVLETALEAGLFDDDRLPVPTAEADTASGEPSACSSVTPSSEAEANPGDETDSASEDAEGSSPLAGEEAAPETGHAPDDDKTEE